MTTSDDPVDGRTAGRDRVGSFSVGDAWWGAAMIAPTGEILDANDEFAAVLGFQVGDLIGRSLVDILGADVLGPERAVARRLVDGEGPVIEYQRHISRPDGTSWDGVIRTSVLRGADGEPELFHVRFAEAGSRHPPERIAWREGDFPLALDAMRVGIAIIGLDGRLLQANQALCEITGRTEEELIETDLLSMTHPDDRVQDVELGTRAWLGELDTYTTEKRVIRPDGSLVWVRQEVTFARDETGKPLHLIGQVIDVSDRKEVESQLARSQRELQDLVEHVPIGLLSSGPDGRIVTANRAAAEIAGLEHMPAGTDVTHMIHPEDLQRIAMVAVENARAGRDYQIEFRLVRPDGTIRWVRNEARADLDADGRLLRIRGTWRDVTDLKAAEELLRHQATRDALTGLSNRHLLFATLAAAIERCAAGQSHLSLLFVDLDGFKAVNDSFGHGVGDRVLTVAADRLAGVARHASVVARIGGDEFIVAIEEPEAAGAELGMLADAIIAAIAEPYDVGSELFRLGASIGIASWQPGLTVDDLVNAADRAVYEAKAAGRNCWRRA